MDPNDAATRPETQALPAPGSAEDPARARAEAALGHLPAGLQSPVGRLLDRWPGRILLQAAAGLGRIEVFDRSMTIAAQFFTSVLPVLILIATLGSNSDSFADAIDMPEQSRNVLEGAVDDGGAAFGIAGAIFVLISATSLSRALARAFSTLWGFHGPPPACARRGAGWPWSSSLRSPSSSLVRPVSHSTSCHHRKLWPRLISFLWDSAVAAFIPWALLAGAVRARLLFPGALLFALLMIAVRPATQAWLPGALEASADRYGSIGDAFTYLTWLYIASFCFLATALVGQVIATDPGSLGDRIRGGPPVPGPADDFTQTE